MSTLIGGVSIVMLLFAVAIAVKRTDDRDDRKRRDELMRIAKERWGTETDLDALAFFYDFIVRQMYRFKHEDKRFDHLVDDANFVLQIRNAIIEENVIREIDRVDGEMIFPARDPSSAHSILQGNVPGFSRRKSMTRGVLTGKRRRWNFSEPSSL